MIRFGSGNTYLLISTSIVNLCNINRVHCVLMWPGLSWLLVSQESRLEINVTLQYCASACIHVLGNGFRNKELDLDLHQPISILQIDFKFQYFSSKATILLPTDYFQRKFSALFVLCYRTYCKDNASRR